MCKNVILSRCDGKHTQKRCEGDILCPLKVHRYLIVDVMMNDGEKWWPVFFFYDNASCKRKKGGNLKLQEGKEDDKKERKLENRSSTSRCSLFPPFDVLHGTNKG
jgi:hypothetical protein